MKKFFLTFCQCILFTSPFYSQYVLSFQQAAAGSKPEIENHFARFYILQTDLLTMYQQTVNDGVLKFEMNGQAYEFNLNEEKLLSENYVVTVASNKGMQILKDFSVKTYSGLREGGNGHLTLTIDKDFFLAMITIGDQEYFIEQMNDVGQAFMGNQLILYNAKDYILSGNYSCGVNDTHIKSQELDQALETRTNSCKVVDLAIASDALMYTKFMSDVNIVLNHNIGVMNNVAYNYRHEFTDNIEYKIVTQYVSTQYANDPLSPNTASTNSGTVLDNFTAWGQSNGFGTGITYDIGQFWTNRDFDGSTVGLAWVGVVCTNNRYHILQDYTDDPGYLRCMTAHEIGHNFNASHDASGDPYIMAPSVSYANIWSSTSKTSISNHISSRTCLATCNGSIIADFDYSPKALCNSGTVVFKDKSVNSSNRNWYFPSGSPATSSVQQPSVTYSAQGSYNATIVVESGLTYKTINDAVTVTTEPSFNFGSCPSPTGTPQDLGPKYVGLSDLAYSSGDATTDGAIYQNRTCLGIGTISPATTYTMFITIGKAPNGYEGYEVYIDYNNNGTFETSEKVGDSGGSGYYGTVDFTFTTPASIAANVLLRMRVVTDYYTNNISGPCYNPIRGQTEDYGVINKVVQILPLDLLSFTGNKKIDANQLLWISANESNVSAYEIERSKDGKVFSAIGQVKAVNSIAEKSYQFLDEGSKDHDWYYRLRIKELNGKEELSKMIYLRGNELFHIDNLNTLVGQLLSFELSCQSMTKTNIYIMDLNGNIILSDQLLSNTGIQTLNYQMPNIQPGMYLLKINSDQGDEIVRKLFKY